MQSHPLFCWVIIVNDVILSFYNLTPKPKPMKSATPK